MSRAVGCGGFGTQYPPLPVDLAANAASLGAIVHRPVDRAGIEHALAAARAADRTSMIYLPVDPMQGVPSYDSWWDVPVAEISEQADVRAARERWEDGKRRQRFFV